MAYKEAVKQEKELFISYGREPEVIAFVAKLKQDLEAGGFSVWLDMKDIQAGSDWHGAIGVGLHKCHAIIPIITTKYITSRYCINELYTADGDKKLIFPIILEDVDFSTSEAAMGVKFVISGINWTWCRPQDDYYTNIQKFMTGMRAKGVGTVNPGTSHSSQSHCAHPPTPQVGPENTAKPIFRIPDVEMVQGITTGPNGEIVCSSGQHNIHIFNSEGEKLCAFGKCG